MELKAEKGKYRKKPVVVDAAEWLCKGHCPVWAQHAVREWHTFFEVTTLEGVMRGEPGDWIVRGVKGEIYPCKGDIFAATYEPAAAEDQPEPVAWFEADGSARGLPLREVLPSLVHSTRWHYQTERPKTTNPVWPVFGEESVRSPSSASNPGLPESAFIPKTPQEMVEFIGSNFDTMQADAWTQEEIQRPAGDLNNVRYSLTVHDLLSAFQWAGLLDAPTPPAGDAGQEQMEAALRTIAEWPVTPAGNMDAENMRRVAGSALAAATAPGAPGREAEHPAAQAAGLTDEGIIGIAELDGVATYETGWYRMTRGGLLAFARALLSRAAPSGGQNA